jgi:hypothetical protein
MSLHHLGRVINKANPTAMGTANRLRLGAARISFLTAPCIRGDPPTCVVHDVAYGR